MGDSKPTDEERLKNQTGIGQNNGFKKTKHGRGRRGFGSTGYPDLQFEHEGHEIYLEVKTTIIKNTKENSVGFNLQFTKPPRICPNAIHLMVVVFVRKVGEVEIEKEGKKGKKEVVKGIECVFDSWILFHIHNLDKISVVRKSQKQRKGEKAKAERVKRKKQEQKAGGEEQKENPKNPKGESKESKGNTISYKELIQGLQQINLCQEGFPALNKINKAQWKFPDPNSKVISKFIDILEAKLNYYLNSKSTFQARNPQQIGNEVEAWLRKTLYVRASEDVYLDTLNFTRTIVIESLEPGAFLRWGKVGDKTAAEQRWGKVGGSEKEKETFKKQRDIQKEQWSSLSSFLKYFEELKQNLQAK